ncbi:MAG TPA: GNAT family N-acetyltransferase [Microcella sp.]|nr:GNAT family N-acetyltransferase [Microcella sp.]
MTALIRSAIVNDAPALGALHMACWREAYGALLSPEFFTRATPESSAARWATAIPRIAADDGVLLLAEDHGELLGFASAGPARGEAPPRERELYALYVRASHYGSGLGAQLLEAAIGEQPASLWVLEQNPRARAFYERHGFRHDGTHETLPDFEGLVEVRYVR